mmetsp:Transcript_24947/g.44444  ORF Transcript_24947/g.44444 Transcript_24947/m.44444 type:complete len:409 (-) Transcript_24947:178-1404(-)
MAVSRCLRMAILLVLAGVATAVSDYHSKPIPVEARGGLLEYSVIYTDRATNSMSSTFQTVMKELHAVLTAAYNAERAVILPGSGSFAMESVARQLCSGKKALVVRLGYFSYRWTDIFEQGDFVSESVVLRATPVAGEEGEAKPQYGPPPIAEVVAAIKRERPAVVFAPHVETSTGILLPNDYIKAMADAAHSVGGLFVLDGVASGMLWVDMEALATDVYITAPQKGWTSPACAGVVILSPAGNTAVSATTSTSMTLNLRKWRDVMDSYLSGGFAYHTTMPTDCLALFRDAAQETQAYGFGKAQEGFLQLGANVRSMLSKLGFKSVAAPGFEAPGVVVVYSEDEAMVKKLVGQGLQLAAGVPLMLDEAVPAAQRFRVGLFGIDKVYNLDRTVSILEKAVTAVMTGKDEL